MVNIWWRKVMESSNPKSRKSEPPKKVRGRRTIGAEPRLESLEHRIVPAPVVSIPASLVVVPGQVLQVPIRVDQLQDDSSPPTGQMGLAAATLFLDPASSKAGGGTGLGNFTLTSITKGPLLLNAPANGLWALNASQTTTGSSEGEIKIAASANAPADDVTAVDPTDGGANPNGDVLCYLNLTVASAATGSDAISYNDSKDTSPLTGGLVPANENGQPAGAIYPNLDDLTYGTTTVNFGVEPRPPPAGVLSIPIDITGTPGQTVTVPVNYTPVTPGGSGISSADAAILFDPNIFVDSGAGAPVVTPGNLIPTDTTENWSITSAVDTTNTNSIDPTKDVLGLHAVAGSGAIASDLGPFTTSGSFWEITFTIQANAPNGTTVINLVPIAKVNRRVCYHEYQPGSDTPHPYLLSPAPNNSADGTGTGSDPTDGSVSVSAVINLAFTNPPTNTTAGQTIAAPAGRAGFYRERQQRCGVGQLHYCHSYPGAAAL